MNYRVWGIPAVLSTGIPGNALRAFPGSFRNFSGISSGKSQPYWGCGPNNININFLLRLPLVRPRNCPRDKPRFALYLRKSSRWHFSKSFLPPKACTNDSFSLRGSGGPGVAPLSDCECDPMPNLIGRPGCRTMEMTGGSSMSYLARTPYIPLFSTLFKTSRGGRGSFPLCDGTFAYDPAGVVQSPKTPESRKYEKITKKIQNPRPQVAPRKYEKITEKIRKRQFFGHFCIFSVIFFVFSGGDLGSGILYFFRTFFVFLGFRGFLALYHPRGIVNLRPVIFGVERWLGALRDPGACPNTVQLQAGHALVVAALSEIR